MLKQIEDFEMNPTLQLGEQ